MVSKLVVSTCVAEILRGFMVKSSSIFDGYLLLHSDHEACHEWKIRKYEKSQLTNFFAISSEKKESEPNVSSETHEPTEITQKEGANTGSRYIQSVKGRKFKEEWCKDMKWLSFNHSTDVARCEICALFSELEDCNSEVVNGFSAPLKLETFKKHDKSFQYLKCIEANNALSVPKSTPLTACTKNSDQKMLDHMKCVYSTAYYIPKHNKPYTDIGGLLALVNKLGVEVRSEYNNDITYAEFVSHIAEVPRKESVSCKDRRT
jgi:hypothetical protein